MRRKGVGEVIKNNWSGVVSNGLLRRLCLNLVLRDRKELVRKRAWKEVENFNKRENKYKVCVVVIILVCLGKLR